MSICPPLGRVLVVSPHLDDAVFSCGCVLASHPGATVVTVFAGDQPRGQSLTEWDRDCGFAPSDDVMRMRRAEDETALKLLAANAVWLAFTDAQYGPAPPVEAIAQALRAEIERAQPDTLLFPLGLFHSDHHVTHAAVLQLLPHAPFTAYGYADALYRRLDRRLEERLSALQQAGWTTRQATLPEADDAPALKARAVQCYRSQLVGLATPGRPGHADIELPEAYWQVAATAEALH